jgi:hypothetical protein
MLLGSIGTAENSGEHEAGHSSGDGSVEQPELVRSRCSGKMVAVPEELAEQLAPLAKQCGVDASEVARKVAAMDGTRQRGVVKHGQQVARYLQQQLGIEQPQLAQLLPSCPILFSYPPAERAQLHLEQLMGLGLLAMHAVACFEKWPELAQVRNLAPTIAWLAGLLAVGCKPQQQGMPGQQRLAQLLRRDPSAGKVACQDS